MRFTLLLFALVAFLALCVAILAVAPGEAASFIYILWASVFAFPLIQILRGKSNSVMTRSSSAVAPKWLFASTLLFVLAGTVAFAGYWLTRSHYAALKIFIAILGLALLILILAGTKFDAQ